MKYVVTRPSAWGSSHKKKKFPAAPGKSLNISSGQKVSLGTLPAAPRHSPSQLQYKLRASSLPREAQLSAQSCSRPEIRSAEEFSWEAALSSEGWELEGKNPSSHFTGRNNSGRFFTKVNMLTTPLGNRILCSF